MKNVIREIRDSDQEQWNKCFIALQSLESTLEPDRVPATTSISKHYWNYIHERASRCSGKIYVAEVNGQVVGFVAVWVESDDGNLITTLKRFGYVSDIAVLPEFQGQGIGHQLMECAEEYLRSLGLRQVKVGVLARNEKAHSFYTELGFADHEVSLLKELK